MHNLPPPNEPPFNRRDFLKGSSFSTLMMLMGGVPLQAAEADKPAEATGEETGGVACGLIGCGAWGRDILKTLATLPKANVLGICDTYPSAMRRAKEFAPKAKDYSSYKEMLANPDIHAVIVATPSHLHREVCVAALEAGKHVYCEAPLASTIEDARAIAAAARKAQKQNFQAGLQLRSDPQRHFLLTFIRSGAMGKTLSARAQWHRKQSWRQPSANAEREKELNWRVSRQTSPGLVGEIGIHQIDLISWFVNARPKAVTGFGGILHWSDGRDVPDTVHTVVEYPDGVNFVYDCTLANSFDADYEMLYGTDSAVMLRQNKAWMFKEVDSPLLGWEVYARKDEFYKETGIALVANATKLVAQGDKPVEDAPFTNTPLYYALEAFLTNTEILKTGIEDFSASFDINDAKALKEYMATLEKGRMPAAGYAEGLEATIIALKSNEAILKGQRLTLEKDLFDLA